MHIKRLLLLGVSILALGGCFSKYEPRDVSDSAATLEFVAHKHIFAGTTYFNAVSDGQCTTNQGRLATLDAFRAASQTVPVPAEKRIFIVGNWLNGFGTHCGGNYRGCLDRCTVVGSFVPKIGSRYLVDVKVSSDACHFDVKNLDFPSSPVSIATFPTTNRCNQVF